MTAKKKDLLKGALRSSRSDNPDSPGAAKPQVREAEGDYAMVPVAAIDPDPNQPRKTFSQEYIGALAASLKLNKQRQPITLIRTVNGRFQIKEGERRWRAAQVAGLEYLKAIIEDQKSDLSSAEQAEVLRAQRAENTDREPLSLWEDIEACARYVELTGKKQKEAAQDLVLSTSKLSKMLKVYKAPASVQEVIRLGVTTNLNTIGSLIELWEASEKAADAEIKAILTSGEMPERSEYLFAQKVRDLKTEPPETNSSANKEPKNNKPPAKTPLKTTTKGQPNTAKAKSPGIQDMKVIDKGLLQITDKSGQVHRFQVTKSWKKQWDALGEALFND